MAYLQYRDYYRQLVLSGQLPFPQYPVYPYKSVVPNICNDCNDKPLFPCGTNELCGYSGNFSYDPFIPDFHYDATSALTYNTPDPYLEKYNYSCYDRTPYQDPSSVMGFTMQILVSNIPNFCTNLDLNLLNPCGIVVFNDVVWVANSGTGLITKYNLLGGCLPPLINVFGPVANIGKPTGIVYNCDVNNFFIHCGPMSAPSMIITATRDGTINAYNCEIDPGNTTIVVNNAACNAVYTGLELFCGVLYAADFYNQKIDVFDGKFCKINDHLFIDENSGETIPENFAPFNIVNIGDFLYVTYAQQNPRESQYESCGVGKGYISIFTARGKFVKRFTSCGVLNAPYGVLLAPSWFGYPSGAIMVGNFGDGKINIFGECGKYLSTMKDEFNNDICIEGLKDLTINPNYLRLVYWTASSHNLRGGCMGTLNTRCGIC